MTVPWLAAGRVTHLRNRRRQQTWSLAAASRQLLQNWQFHLKTCLATTRIKRVTQTTSASLILAELGGRDVSDSKFDFLSPHLWSDLFPHRSHLLSHFWGLLTPMMSAGRKKMRSVTSGLLIGKLKKGQIDRVRRDVTDATLPPLALITTATRLPFSGIELQRSNINGPSSLPSE